MKIARYLPVTSLLFAFIISTNLFGKPQHAIATNGTPKYPENFTHFDYVNPNAPKGGTLVLARVGTFNSFNPFMMKGDPAAGIGYIDESYLHGCLMARAEDEPDTRYGMIAQSIEIAPDRSWVDFVIRPEARFSDNTPIKASDVVFTFETLMSKGLPFFKMYYKAVKSVEALSPQKVRFHIQDTKNKEIQNVLGQMPVLSKKFYQKYNFQEDTLIPPIGAGPYIIKSFIPGREIVFERIPNWWGDNLPCMKGRFNPETIKIIYFRDEAVVFEAFKAGKYDLRMESTIQRWLKGYDFPAVRQGHVIKKAFKIPTFIGTALLAFNNRKPIFEDIRVRQALSLVLDFSRLNKRLFGGMYKRSYSYFAGSYLDGHKSPSLATQELLRKLDLDLPEHMISESFRYTYPHQKMSSYDRLVFAQKLLRDAGYVNIEDTLIHKITKQPLKFSILLPRSSPNLIRVIQDYTRNLERIGIQVTLRIVEESQFILATQKFDFDIVVSISNQTLSPGNEQMDFWSCAAAKKEGGRNLAGVCSPVIDKAINEVIAADSYEKLITATQALDRLLLWGFYNIPLWHTPHTLVAYKRKIQFPKTIEKITHFNIDTLWIEEPARKKQ